MRIGTLRLLTRWSWAGLLGIGLVGAACGSFEESAPPADTEAGVVDGAVVTDGAVAAQDAGDGNLIGVQGVVVSEDFETDNGCGLWAATNATGRRDTTDPHAGKASCRFCRADQPGIAPGQLARPFAGRGPGLYRLEGHVRGGTATRWSFRMDDHEPGSDPSSFLQPYAAIDGPLTPTWTPQSLDKTATLGTELVALIYVGAEPDAGDAGPLCYYIDDLKITYTPAQ